MIENSTLTTLLARVRSERPLIHNITNYVVMNTTANALLALGASPVMAHAREEVEEMTSIARALVINLGTLSPPWIESMLQSMKTARARGIPTVLDPVGVGATRLRNQTAASLLEQGRPTVVRGNASEILALDQTQAKTKGVDSTHRSEDAIRAAERISNQHECVVCISGQTDWIVYRSSIVSIHNGHAWMSQVTGMGCTATALIGAFAAVCPSPEIATQMAMATMGVTGEIAAQKSQGPGSFQVRFLDCLAELTPETLQNRAKIKSAAVS